MSAIPRPKGTPRKPVSSTPVARDWDLETNGLPSELFGVGSAVKAHWRCATCGHRWQSRISCRAISGQGCPACAREAKRGPQRPLTEVEHLVGEWHPTRNGSVTPADEGTGSKIKRWWSCSACSHEWQAATAMRVHGHGCPVCRYRRGPRKTVSDLPLMTEWDVKRNAAEGHDPTTMGQSVETKVWWICSTCSHSWKTGVRSRNQGGRGCPACRDRQTAERVRKSLATHPLAVEYAADLNQQPPASLRWRDRAVVWWRCGDCTSTYQRSVASRVGGGSGCPHCSGGRWTKQALQSWLLTHQPQTEEQWLARVAAGGIRDRGGVGRTVIVAAVDHVVSWAELTEWALHDGHPVIDSLLTWADKTRTPIPAVVRQAVYERDNHRCLACEDTEDLVCDHVIPYSKGGAHDITNLQTLCDTCNSIKSDRGDMSLAEIAQRKAEIAWYAHLSDPQPCEGIKKDGDACSFWSRRGERFCTRHLVTPTAIPPFEVTSTTFRPVRAGAYRPSPKRATWQRPKARVVPRCASCTAEVSRRARQCKACKRAVTVVRDSLIRGMWADGWTMQEIADALKTTRQSVIGHIGVARKRDPASFPLREPAKSRPRSQTGL